MTDLNGRIAGLSSPLARLVDDYFMACRARGLARSTITGSYGYPLQRSSCRGAHGRHHRAGPAQPRTMDAFSVHLLERGGKDGRTLEKSSVHAYVRAVRGFLNWCEHEGEGKVPGRRCPGFLAGSSTSSIATRSTRSKPARSPSGTASSSASSATAGSAPRSLLAAAGSVIRRDRQAHLSVHGKGSVIGSSHCHPLSCGASRATSASAGRRNPFAAALLRSPARPVGDYEPLTPSGVLQLVRGPPIVPASRSGCTPICSATASSPTPCAPA